MYPDAAAAAHDPGNLCGGGYAFAEGVATGDLPAICQECGDQFDAQSSWAVDEDGTHVIRCIHGVALEESRHTTVSSWSFQPFNETQHVRICGYADCDVAISFGDHSANCGSPTTCVTCGATDITAWNVSHEWPDRDTCTYLYDNEKHWAECPGCGEPVYSGGHFASCTNPGVCKTCGQSNVTFAAEPAHSWDETEEYDWNSVVHWYVCQDCGGKYMMQSHWATCDDPTTCIDCGATGITADVGHVGLMDGYDGYDSTHHWVKCEQCGLAYYNEHVATCADPTVCYLCGAENITASYIEHNRSTDSYLYDEKYHWVECADCGELLEKEEHITTCLDKGESCVSCGQPVPDGGYEHWNDHDELVSDADEHWYVCGACGEEWGREEHAGLCNNPGVCWLCGEPTDVIMHDEDSAELEQGTDTHWWTCQECGEKIDEEAHTPATDDPTKCSVCGAAIPQPTAKPTTAPTDEPTAKPTTAPTDEPTAKPTTAPTDEPTTEPTASMTPIPLPTMSPVPTEEPTEEPKPVVPQEPVHEHTFDVAFVSNGDGTHSKACLSGCGETLTEACTLVTTDMGLMTCTACAKCGYAVYAAKASVSALNEGESVPAVVVRVERATIEAAEEATAVPEQAVLVVHETTFEVPVTLPEEINGTVKKVFTAALLMNGEDIQPASAVKLTIPVDEDTLAILEGKVLMLLREDGTLLEIPFEIIDGEIVFLTDELGVFLLMEPETAEPAI